MNTIPNNTTDWISSLPNRPGWRGWDNVGQSVLEGVQNWSSEGDETTAVGVWGNVAEDPYGDKDPEINWSVYLGTDKVGSDFETAEDAMDYTEHEFPEMFKKPYFKLSQK